MYIALYFHLVVICSASTQSEKVLQNRKKFPTKKERMNDYLELRNESSSSYSIFSNETNNSLGVYRQRESRFKRKATREEGNTSTKKPNDEVNEGIFSHYSLNPYQEFLKLTSKFQEYDFKLANLSLTNAQILSMLKTISVGLDQLKDSSSHAMPQTNSETQFLGITQKDYSYEYEDVTSANISDKIHINASKVLQRSERQSEDVAAKNLSKAMKDYFRKHVHAFIAWSISLLCIVLIIILCCICCKRCCKKLKKKFSSRRKKPQSGKAERQPSQSGKESPLLLKWSFPTDENAGVLPVRNMVFHAGESRHLFNSSGGKREDTNYKKEEQHKNAKLIMNFKTNVTDTEEDNSTDTEDATFFRNRSITGADIQHMIRKLMRRERKCFAFKANSLNASMPMEELPHLIRPIKGKNGADERKASSTCIPSLGTLAKTIVTDHINMQNGMVH